MCLGIPGEIVAVRDDGGLRIGTVRFAGITRDVCLDYVANAVVGEYVLVPTGGFGSGVLDLVEESRRGAVALSRIDADEAARAYRILEGLGQTAELTADRSP